MCPVSSCAPAAAVGEQKGRRNIELLLEADARSRSTLPAPEPVPKETDEGLEAPLLKLNISIHPSAPDLVDSPLIPSIVKKNLDTHFFTSSWLQFG